MTTKTTTTGTNNTAFNFDPASMGAYHNVISTLHPWLMKNVTNPFSSDAFNQESAISQDQAANMGARMKSNVLNNAAALGYSTNGGLFNSMLNRAGRDTSTLQAQGFRGAIQNAIGRQMGSAQMLNAFQPLMQGSNSNFNQTQAQSGLGTWLPQVAGMALGAAMPFMPGMGAAAGAAGKGISAAAGASGGFLNNAFGNGTPSFGGLPSSFNPFTASGPSYGYGAGINPSGNFINPYLFGAPQPPH